MESGNCIGVFDSGVGGLSVLRHIRALLPNENLLYVADSGNAPYGNKPLEWIEQRSMQLTAFLAEHGAKAIVVACNTATAAAAAALRQKFTMPIIAMEPAVKPAVAATRNHRIGVLATVGTLQSARFAALLERFADGVEVVTQHCPGWVEAVERGELDTTATRQLVRSHVEPLLEQGADTLVLGCTHYPFLRPLIEEIAGANIPIIDTGEAVARQLKRRLAECTLQDNHSAKGSEAFWCSADSSHAGKVMSLLWKRPIIVLPLPEIANCP